MLHIVNKSHTQTGALASCLRFALPGSALLLTEDAIYAATAAAAATSGVATAVARIRLLAAIRPADADGKKRRPSFRTGHSHDAAPGARQG